MSAVESGRLTPSRSGINTPVEKAITSRSPAEKRAMGIGIASFLIGVIALALYLANPSANLDHFRGLFWSTRAVALLTGLGMLGTFGTIVSLILRRIEAERLPPQVAEKMVNATFFIPNGLKRPREEQVKPAPKQAKSINKAPSPVLRRKPSEEAPSAISLQRPAPAPIQKPEFYDLPPSMGMTQVHKVIFKDNELTIHRSEWREDVVSTLMPPIKALRCDATVMKGSVIETGEVMVIFNDSTLVVVEDGNDQPILMVEISDKETPRELEKWLIDIQQGKTVLLKTTDFQTKHYILAKSRDQLG